MCTLLQQHIHIAQTPVLNYFHRLRTQWLEKQIQSAGMTVLFWMSLLRQLFPWCLTIKSREGHSWSSLQGSWAVTAVRSWKHKDFYSDDGQKFIRQMEDKDQQSHNVLMHDPGLQNFGLCICQHICHWTVKLSVGNFLYFDISAYPWSNLVKIFLSPVFPSCC